MLTAKTMNDAERKLLANGYQQSPVDVRDTEQTDGIRRQDAVTIEIPIAMVYNGISHAVMMATPTELEDFALGFSLSEGILQKPEQLYDCKWHSTDQGLTVNMTIASKQAAALKNRRRNLTGRTGCGLCGTESLQEAIRPVKRVVAPQLSDDAIQHAVNSLQQYQPLQAQTGASHGAAWCVNNGDIRLVREDVGRHNALDKLIGALMKAHTDLTNGFALVSSRASYEMVHKSCAVGMGALVAVSAPTSLAIDQAREAGQLLIGFARTGRHVIYNQPIL